MVGLPLLCALCVRVCTWAQVAAGNVFEIMDAKSKVDPYSKDGLKPASCSGRIEFKDVCFAYPQRPDLLALKHVSFVIPAGSFAAFVGASGCGKSTIIRLLLRFYDVTSGVILLDGVDIRVRGRARVWGGGCLWSGMRGRGRATSSWGGWVKGGNV